jgi:sugar lactone lactonase YvrE
MVDEALGYPRANTARWDRRLALGLALAASAAIAVLAVNWWCSHPGAGLVLERGLGYSTLVSRDPGQGTWVYRPTGAPVAYLSNTDMNVLAPSERFLFTSHERKSSAGVTRIDLVGNTVEIVVAGPQFSRLDGLLWTPWGTLLVSEEIPQGKLFEILNPLAKPSEITYVERPAFGARRHEGLAIDSRGYLYGVDEVSDGGIYRFRPNSPGTKDALAEGKLEVLILRGAKVDLERGRVPALWVAAESGMGTGFYRPEDVELVGATVYVAVTREDRVLSIDLASEMAPSVGVFVGGGPLARPDSLASDPEGNLYVTEDVGRTALLRGDRNHIWFVEAADDPLASAKATHLFDTIDSNADEASGVLVDSAGRWLYVNLLGRSDSVMRVALP